MNTTTSLQPATPPGPAHAALAAPDEGTLPPPDAAAPLAAAAIEDRVQRLFRLSTRRGLIHPLQHLLLRYRRGESA